jgi:hypothetical protein
MDWTTLHSVYSQGDERPIPEHTAILGDLQRLLGIMNAHRGKPLQMEPFRLNYRDNGPSYAAQFRRLQKTARRTQRA